MPELLKKPQTPKRQIARGTMMSSVEFLADLVSIGGASGGEEFISSCEQVLQNHFEPKGFRIQKLGSVAPSFVIYEASLGDIPQVFDLAFLGHLDTVPPGPEELWNSNPFKLLIKDEVAHGRGVVDMLGSVYAFSRALEEAKYGGFDGKVVILLTTDEETTSKSASALADLLINDEGVEIRRLLVGEPSSTSDIGDVIRTGRRGSANFDLKIKGIQGHIAYPENFRNPVDLAAHAILDLLQLTLGKTTEFFPLSNLEFSDMRADFIASNVVPAFVNLKLNVRYNDSLDSDAIMHSLKEKLDENQNLDYDIALVSDNPPYLTSGSDFSQLVSSSVEAVTGTSPRIDNSGGTSDARFFARLDNEIEIVELGLKNSLAHKANESAPMSDVASLQSIYSEILAGLKI